MSKERAKCGVSDKGIGAPWFEAVDSIEPPGACLLN
jgi:hypothetical protein